MSEEFFSLQKEHSSAYDSGANGTNFPDVGQFILSFDARATMSPVARLLVYYVRDDGEIIADARKFRISQCLLNKVSLHFRHDQQYPSTEAAMLLSASPSSLCGIGLVDKSVQLLRRDKQFDKHNIFKLMEDYDVGRKHRPWQERKDYCQEKEDINRRWRTRRFTPPLNTPLLPFERSDYFHHATSTYADATMAFEEAGMVVISDLTLETRPCLKNQPIALPVAFSVLPGHYGPAIGTSAVQPAREPPPVQENSVSVDFTDPLPKSATEIRNYFPETWLWELHKIGENGEIALKRTLPHTITEWVGNAICVHPKTGLGISDDSKITAFQPFFVAFNLPYSVIRGENIPIIVTVFNYLSDCLPIKLSMESSEEYKTLSHSNIHKMCVCGGKSETHKFLIKPTGLGLVNITVYGYSLEDDDICGEEISARLKARDAVTRQLLVEAEGFPKEEVYNYYFCPAHTNGSYATEIDLLLPENVVDGSATAYMHVSGDLMGPVLKGLNHLVKLPVGCGEQNMVLFTPNIFVLDYMMSTQKEKVSESLRDECIKNMKTGYQRALQYRHSDGSYSAFGKSDASGSLWLTAFVVKSFSQARRFITLDENDLTISTQWIVQKQFENGCFAPYGKLLNNAMKGGLSDGEQSLAPLTAYVLISLLEAGYRENNTIQNAIHCLEQEKGLTSYTLALFSYAAALAKHPLVNSYVQQLERQAVRKGSLMYWEHSRSNSKSISVEIAGYYILSLIELEGETAKALPVVKWIAKQRNSNGGFISTQDTVIALQALAKYSSLQSDNTLDIGIAVESDELIHGFKLEESNKMMTQIIQIPVLPTVVDLQAVGDGCAVMQVSLLYNVIGSNDKRVTGSDVFDLSVNTARLGSVDCNLPRIGICIRYKLQGQETNMVVLSVKMASGFLPDEDSLQKLKSKTDLQLKRFEIDENEVNFYFSELSNDQKCFSFFVTNVLEIEEIKPAAVKLYDYYQPDLRVVEEYEIPTMCAILNLPEFPRLPPIIVITEDELDEMATLSWTNNETEADFEIIPITDTQTSQTSTSETLTEQIREINVSSTQLSDGADQSTIHYSSLDASTEHTADVILDAEVSTHPIVDASHLDNFVDVDHDLDFPEGIEGNKPVTVHAPDLHGNNLSFEMFELDCPVCINHFPENFTDIYCNSAFVLRIDILDRATKSVKILQDLSCCDDQPIVRNVIGKLVFDEDCVCSYLQDDGGGSLLIIGDLAALWNFTSNGHFLQMRSGVHVIPLSTEKHLKVEEARIICNADP